MLFPIPRMLFPLLLVYPFPDSEEDQEPLSESCPMEAVVISGSLRALPAASLIILAGFCCYSPSSRSPLPSPIQMPPAQATVPPLALPSRPLVGATVAPCSLKPPPCSWPSPQCLSGSLWYLHVQGPLTSCASWTHLLLSPTRPSGAVPKPCLCLEAQDSWPQPTCLGEPHPCCPVSLQTTAPVSLSASSP